MSDYPSFPKIPRLHRDVILTEKIDGTNGLVSIERHQWGTAAGSVAAGVTVLQDESVIGEDGFPEFEWHIRAGSRNRWLAPGSDNFGFAAWVAENAADLVKLGPGNHYGEWFGKGIQRGYGLNEKRFALFGVHRWFDPRNGDDGLREKFPNARPCPEVTTVVPVLYSGPGDDPSFVVRLCLRGLEAAGSIMVPGFGNPEGLIVYHTAGGHTYKVLLEGDDRPKGVAA